MVTSLSELRKNKSNMMNKLVQTLDAGNKKSYDNEDNRFWKLSRDAVGNGAAVLRFLPAVNGDEIPWVTEISYGFQGPTGKWYINKSPYVIGQPCPAGEYSAAAYQSKDPVRIEQAKAMKRSKKYISNVLIVKDPANPENEGKVMLFKYGKKIHDMITGKMKPVFADDEPIDVFDIDEGCNFKLRAKIVSDFVNYDSSEWAGQSPLAKTDEEIQAILDKCHRLGDFTDPSYFKSYDKLKEEFDRAMYGTTTAAVPQGVKAIEEQLNQVVQQVQIKETAPVRKVESAPLSAQSNDIDDDMAAFENLLNSI